MEDCNVLLLNVKLQEAFDAHHANTLENLLDDEHGIDARCVFMRDLIRSLRTPRIDKKEDDMIILNEEDEDILDRINQFREIWPVLQEKHKGILTDDHNPFSEELEIEIVAPPGGPQVVSALGAHVDIMLDRLSILIDQEQNSLSHVTRKLKYQTDLANHCATMTAERAKHNPNKTFVYNQIKRS